MTGRRMRSVLVGTVVLLMFTLGGCVLQQGISMSRTNTGWATTDLYVYDFFKMVLEDFEPFSPEERTVSLMDASIDDFVQRLHETTSASDVSSMKIGENGYFIDFTFSSLEALLQDLNKQEPQTIVKVAKRGSETTLSVFLDLGNYPQLTRMVPFLADPNFETFGPLYNEGMSEEEYLDMISYILGGEGPTAIEESVISLRLTAPVAIKRQQGGVMESPNSIRFDIPLIDFLLLAKPITFSATW